MQRRGTVVAGFVRIRPVLEEHLDNLQETVGQTASSSGVIPRAVLRPVDLDTTPTGRPLQQPPRRVHLPAVRGAQQRGQFVPVPPN